ncbi:ABATE domain-containing protein [Streptomyces sp. MBT65]|uniref:CGNR zinc finger domain-containing protein n=1 Tax=Streptomyces sp. MBT65 TaxID=1488395 RepID=UPI001909B832|nr:CGNR zinc finger domain-containing protein [Streptomyces sp. MBT65]MBK3575639.1 ABATE domain-containing protein [Streptomyces sp. MBT65]
MEFTFVSGHPALDLAATLTWRSSYPIELLVGPRDLSQWIEQAGLADVAGRVDDADVERMRKLREAVYRTASADLSDQQPRAGDLRLISRTAAGKQVTPVLEELGRAVWRGDVDQVRATVAHQACVLLGGSDYRRIRACVDTECTRLFIDHSRSGSRRWCDKQTCGGRANAAAYRRRRSQPSPR